MIPVIVSKKVAEWGVVGTAIRLAILLAVLYLLTSIAWLSVSKWYYKNKAEKQTAVITEQKLDIGELKENAKQSDRADTIQAETIEKQDAATIEIHAANTKATEVIHERIKIQPVVVPVPDDPIVRAVADEAYQRAIAARNKVRGTQAER